MATFLDGIIPLALDELEMFVDPCGHLGDDFGVLIIAAFDGLLGLAILSPQHENRQRKERTSHRYRLPQPTVLGERLRPIA